VSCAKTAEPIEMSLIMWTQDAEAKESVLRMLTWISFDTEAAA